MATFASDSNLQEYEPDILKFGIQDFSDLHAKSYDDIIRLLQIKWWPTTQYSTIDISVIGNQSRLSPSRLDSTQFTRAASYHVLLREGVSYDSDSSGTYTDSERTSFHTGRLVR